VGHAASTYGLWHGDDRPRVAHEPRSRYGATVAPDPVSLAAIGAYVARFRQA
jgi:hypothetical protein